ncbi:transcriptional regulator [Streptomyces sp. PTM05]|uniref:Transcriptional regulator n=1 Tax=Streptantibioticus parmotrematis TaxID=2873249 RepID=A0ABS7QYL2_9ACTN|nr:transcriptional regulator [Streptantibioticus parmotrematis]MBY8888305.1 transcriptional regulator [Streptantibioticus parmotrematis]
MTRTAREVLDTAAANTAPDEDANRLVPRVVDGSAPVEALAAFAMEQRHVIDSDRRAFLRLAERSADRPATARFFASLANGETLAAERLTALIDALGLDDETVRGHRPHPGCQAYPAYVAWLALNAEPVDAVVSLGANFAAWGGYCAAVGRALRTSYGFSDAACGFFDFFAEPAPALEAQALEAVQEGLDGGRLDTGEADRYGRLLQAYELMFWNTLAGLPG